MPNKRTILIVDDERMIRLGLIHMIEELYQEKYLCLEAKNGAEALKTAACEKPEMIFLDIRMPVKDGLSTLPELVELLPNVQIVLLTGFSEFDYAKTAIKYGITDYLLKPCSPDDIKSAIDRMEAHLQEQTSNRNVLFAVDMTRILDLYFNKDIKPEETRNQVSQISFCIIYTDTKDSMHAGNLCKLLIRDFGSYPFPPSLSLCNYFLPTGELCLITAGNRGDYLIDFMKSSDSAKDAAITAVSFEASDLITLLTEVDQFQDMNYLRCYITGQCCSYIHLAQQCSINSMPALANALEQTALAFLLGDTAAFYTGLVELEQFKTEWHTYAEAYKASAIRFFASLTGYPVEYQTGAGLLALLPNSIPNSIQATKLNSDDLMVQIKDFVSRNCKEDISIQKLGEIFRISPNYLSKIFHDRTGMRYIDYVTWLRIERSKALLLGNSNLTVQQVSEQVGYYSSRHFTKTFKKLTGVLPTEYKEQTGR